jgi:DNA-binding MarR family transcriptional regulator
MYDPGDSPERDVLALIDEVPKAFFRLSATAEIIFADLGVSGAERGVLRDLFFDGERTAPELARRKPVTRQAIQSILDDLVRKGFIRAAENPRHKRSKLYVLTQAGINVCVKIRERELAEIGRLLRSVDDLEGVDFEAAARAVSMLTGVLQDRLEGRR